MADEKKRVVKFSKVHRSIYSFNISRLIVPVRRFVKKTTELTPEAIRDYISSLFKATVRKDVEAKKHAKAMEYQSPFMKNIVLIGVAVMLLIVGYGAYIYSSIGETVPLKNETRAEPPPLPVISGLLADAGFLDSGAKDTRWFSTVDIEGNGLDQLMLSLVVQQNEVPSEVYVLRVPNYQLASHYPEFYATLKESLAQRGIFISEITVSDLLSMPQKRKITLIVPSGYMPSVFVGGARASFDMKTFARTGNVLIYIGYPPSSGVLTADAPGPQQVSQETLRAFGLNFVIDDTKAQAFSFDKPQFAVKEAGTEAMRPTVQGQAGEYSVSWGGEGFVYFIPTTIDFWWNTPNVKEKSALELADAIASARWGRGIAKGTLAFNATDDSIRQQRVTVFTEAYRPQQQEGRIGKAFGQLFIQGVKQKDNSSSSTGRVVPVYFGDRPLGVIEHDEVVVSSTLTDQPIGLRYTLNEKTTALKQAFLSVISSNGTEMTFVPMTAGPISLKIMNAQFQFNGNLPSGRYVMRVTDSDHNKFAQSYVSVASFTIFPVLYDFPRGTFTFDVVLEGQAEPYSSVLKHITVSFDGADLKDVMTTKGQILYNATPTTVPGNHTFMFTLGQDRVPVRIEYIRPISLFEKPENIIMALVTIALFAVGVFITRPEIVSYNVDVPDFPPLQAIAIPVKKEVIIDMFESINRELRWQQTPLSVPDLKTGFKKILYRGRPILVGDYNLEILLDQLREQGYIERSMDYYGLKRWERETRKSIHSLAMARALRDTFVNEGIPFLPFGQRGDADTVISYGGEKVFIHIYESDSVIKRAIGSASLGRSIVAFENELVLHDFLSRIHSASEMNVIFKLLLESGKVSVVPVGKLMDVLNRKTTFRY